MPRCEIDNICEITLLDPCDENFPMDICPAVSFVCDAYEEICAISKREKIERFKNNKHQIVYLSTLEHLDLWMKLQSWETAPVTPEDFLHYITIFHRCIVNERLK